MNCGLEFSSFLPEHESDIQFDMKLWGTSLDDVNIQHQKMV